MCPVFCFIFVIMCLKLGYYQNISSVKINNGFFLFGGVGGGFWIFFFNFFLAQKYKEHVESSK